MIPQIDAVKVPMLNVAGWWDQEDFYGPIRIYQERERYDTKSPNRLVVGPWNHAMGELSFDKPATATATDSFVSDPDHPVPYRHRPIQATYFQGGSKWSTWLVEDQRFVLTSVDRMLEKAKRVLRHDKVRSHVEYVGYADDLVILAEPCRCHGFKYFIDAFSAFSYLPLRLSTFLGFAVATGGFLYAIVVIVQRLFLGLTLP